MHHDAERVYIFNKNASLREKNGSYFVLLPETKLVYEVSKLGAAILQESRIGLSRSKLFSKLHCDDVGSDLAKKIDNFLEAAIESKLIACK